MSREQLLDAANRPRAEVVITQEDNRTESPSGVATRSGMEHGKRKSYTGEQE
jgi:hypothetical protein